MQKGVSVKMLTGAVVKKWIIEKKKKLKECLHKLWDIRMREYDSL